MSRISSRRRSKLRRLAPKHPKGPEAHIRLAVSKLFGEYHKRIVDTVIHYATVAHREHQVGTPSALGMLARNQPVALSARSMMDSVLAGLRDNGRHTIKHSPFRQTVTQAAKKTADSVTDQLSTALELDTFEPDLDDNVKELIANVYDSADARMGESIERAQDILEEWDGEDVDELREDLDDGLGGIFGSALASVALAFGIAFAGMNKDAQEEADVGQYCWITQHDGHVRPEHAALDGEIADWDDALLSAEDSDNGEECWPGDDFGCRCVAAPVSEAGEA